MVSGFQCVLKNLVVISYLHVWLMAREQPFGLSSIFTRIFLSVCRRLLPTCLPHLLKNWQQVQLVPQKVLQILLIECRICRCSCIFYMYMYIYTHSYNRLYYWSLFIAAVWDFQVTETCCFGCALLFSPRCVARSFCLPRRVQTIVMPRRVIC